MLQVREKRSPRHERTLPKPLTLSLESASVDEIERRLREEVYVTQIEVAVG